MGKISSVFIKRLLNLEMITELRTLISYPSEKFELLFLFFQVVKGQLLDLFFKIRTNLRVACQFFNSFSNFLIVDI